MVGNYTDKSQAESPPFELRESVYFSKKYFT